jgi:hypothetical protein
MTTIDASAGGYSFIPGVFQYSAGVAALPGFRIERVRFSRLLPLRDGFARAARIVEAAGRPLTAFCACELRSPAPFTEEGFRVFNESYVNTLVDWGVVKDGPNPVARSNVCPDVDPPASPSFHAFAFTTVAANASPSFVIAGSGEAPEGMENYRDHIVRRGDLSREGLRDKARWVLGEMERRMAAFGMSWQRTTAVQLYTVHDIYPFLRDELVRRGAARHGVTWHFDRPPIVDIEYEMDCRAVDTERVVEI